MNISLFKCDTNNFRAIDYDQQFAERVNGFQKQKLKMSWSPAQVDLTKDDFPIPDVMQLDYRVPVFTDEMFKKLQDEISSGIEALELVSPVGQLVALNVIEELDCLDVKRSSVRQNRFGRIMDIRDGVFKLNMVQNEGIFRIQGNSMVFVTEKLLDKFADANGKGFVRSPVGRAE